MAASGKSFSATGDRVARFFAGVWREEQSDASADRHADHDSGGDDCGGLTFP
jgi:hypothetical protein